MISFYKSSICFLQVISIVSVGEPRCMGNDCANVYGDDSVLLQSRAAISNMNLDLAGGQNKMTKKCGWTNMNRGSTEQSSTCYGGYAKYATDGEATETCSMTCKDDNVNWVKWTTDRSIDVQKVKITASNSNAAKRLRGSEFFIGDQKCSTDDGAFEPGETKEFPCDASGTEVKLELPNKEVLKICDFQIFACWEEIDFSYIIDPSQAKASQFLIKATFGPTATSLKELTDLGSEEEWIHHQMNVPLQSHREYLRLRVNPSFNKEAFMSANSHAEADGGFPWLAKGPCAEGARWSKYIFKHADKGSEVKVTQGKIYVGGVFRSDLDTSATGDWNSVADGYSAIICRVTAKVDGNIRLGKSKSSFLEEETNSTGGPKGYDPCEKNLVDMTNPAAHFVSSSDWTKPKVGFEENDDIPDSIFVSTAPTGKCKQKADANIKYNGAFYVPDSRMDMLRNDIEHPAMCAPRTFLNRNKCKVNPSSAECPLVCGSPYEVANAGKYGHQFEFRILDKHDFGPDFVIDSDHRPDHWTKDDQAGVLWTQIALNGNDQLRQRVAWALSQIIVAAYGSQSTERAASFYDIFVRHAFGNFRDILQEVTNSPTMSQYLTYLDSRSFDASGSYPDENYAREIMQLFTIGLETLNEDGTVVMDDDGHAVETYTNEHIMNFARIMTGFTFQKWRWNIERNYKGAAKNRIDPLRMNSDIHDVYPKPDLEGNYIGDLLPLCSDLPKESYLAKGARYEFLGYDEDAYSSYLVLDEASALFAKLCSGSAKSCDYSNYVELDAKLDCYSTDCQLEAVEIVKVGDAFFEYVRPTCVYMFFSNQMMTSHNRYSGKTKCQPVDTPAAGVTCCAGCTNEIVKSLAKKGITCENAETKWLKKGKPLIFEKFCAKNKGWRKQKYCEMTCWKKGGQSAYEGSDCSKGAYSETLKCSSTQDVVTFNSALNFCKSKGMSLCNEGAHDTCSDDQIYLWKETPCDVNVIVHEDGKVSGEKNPEANKFAVEWVGSAAPSGHDTITVKTTAAFPKVPNEKGIKSLKIGAFPPSVPCTHSCSGDIQAFSASGDIDEDTIFKYDGKYFKNQVSHVILSSGGKFRNPAVFLSKVLSKSQKSRAALAEVDTFVDHLFYHPNTPVAISKKLIQRFETSNPSPDYTRTVAQAFKHGKYNGIGSGEYGDLAATVAAILLYPSAHSMDEEGAGLLREPLLKYMHVLRSLEFSDAYPIYSRSLEFRIGEWPYRSPTVFNFYEADYSPTDFGKSGKLLAPEFQIFTPPWAIDLLNGLTLTFQKNRKDGLVKSINAEFGFTAKSEPSETLKQLDLLLTGGRMTKKDAATIAAAFDNAPVGSKLEAAETAITFTPEFHTTGNPKVEGHRPDETIKEHVAKAPYKAMVNIFFAGGADTYQMLVPRDCALHDDYKSARAGMNLDMKSLLSIQAKTQACKNFGLHPKLVELQKLYDLGELAFVSNVGSLTQPTTRAGLKSGSYSKCPNQYSHSHAQAGAQTLQCQTLTSAKGIGGKFADILEKNLNLKSSSYSLAGMKIFSDGDQTSVSVLDDKTGVKRLRDYKEMKPLLYNLTSELFGNVYCEEYAAQIRRAVVTSEEMGGFLDKADSSISDFVEGSKLQNQLRQVARTIATKQDRNAERDFFYVQLGGFDTHADVIEVLDERFDTISKSIAAFVNHLKEDETLWKSVVVTTESDFGRTLTFNGAGSDHGWGGNYFVFGGCIKGGAIYNDFLDTYQQGGDYDAGRGRVIPKYPYENFMVPVGKWLGLDEDSLHTIFPNYKNFNSSMILGQDVLFDHDKGPLCKAS